MPKPKIDITEAVVHSRKLLPFSSGAHVDRNLPGFMVLCGRVSRTYAYQREVNGKTIRVNLGQVGEITAENARLEALKAKKAIDAGQNPNVTRRIESAKAIALDEAYELYKKSEKRSPKTLELYDTMFRLYLKPWAEKYRHTLESIGLDRPGVRKLHEDITAVVKAKIESEYKKRVEANAKRRVPRELNPMTPHPGESTANNCLLLLKGVYNRARTEVPALPEDPTKNVNWHDDHQRQNSLKPDDIRGWYKRVQALTNPVKRTYWLAVLLTGARRNSVAEARWSDINLEEALWHFPNPKGGEEMRYTVPISRYLLDRLKELKEHNANVFTGERMEWAFPSDRSKCGHLTFPRNDKQGLPMSHSLRHTYRTHSLLAGVSDLHSHMLMNHRIEGVNAGYISRHVAMPELAESQEKITRHFLKLFGVIKDEAPSEVVKKPATVFELELKRSMSGPRRKAQ
ncbi:MAG: integrase family protein [Bryobacterales bacterium]|nr:integrase family protein [Bryobacterales bacterium]